MQCIRTIFRHAKYFCGHPLATALSVPALGVTGYGFYEYGKFLLDPSSAYTGGSDPMMGMAAFGVGMPVAMFGYLIGRSWKETEERECLDRPHNRDARKLGSQELR